MAGLRSIPAPAGETECRRVSVLLTLVHPRACGGNCAPAFPAISQEGPSPRLRGKRRQPEATADRRRSIPAPAGETMPSARRPPSPRVHPRACGGNNLPSVGGDLLGGPSPRLRGKRPAGRFGAPARRSIPAPAGETPAGPPWPPASGVHPRACGGNDSRRTCRIIARGPSPRLRGKPSERNRKRFLARSIPAPAGETRASRVPNPKARVHPRACGGNATRQAPKIVGQGPSPRLRGKLRAAHGVRSASGSIPAPAGETAGLILGRCHAEVHPRACGGNALLLRQRIEGIGPSPRLRGKRRTTRGMPFGRWSIPAPAGETSRLAQSLAQTGVHPRACGGNHILGGAGGGGAGPSPRLRGKPAAPPPPGTKIGSIPAPAGETRLRMAA